MTISRDKFDETKNYTIALHEEGVPVPDADINVDRDIRKRHVRRAITELLGNGSPNDGFLLSGSELDPDIGLGSLYLCGLRVGQFAAMTESTQPEGTQTPPAGDGLWYLKVKEIDVDSAADPDIIDAEIGIECHIYKGLQWSIHKVLGFVLPAPAVDEYHISLATETATVFADVRNSGEILAGGDTGFDGLTLPGGAGGKLGEGHLHNDEEILVDMAEYTGETLDVVLLEIDTRVTNLEGGGGAVGAHAGNHESGGSDPMALNSIAGNLDASKVAIAGSGVGGHTDLEAHATDAGIHGGGGVTDHSALTNLAWSLSGHSIDDALNMGGNGIFNLPSPSGGSQATNKTYVDGAIATAISGVPSAPDLEKVRPFKVTVSPVAGEGDYTTLAAALAYMATGISGTVWLKAGVHVITANISHTNVDADITIAGERGAIIQAAPDTGSGTPLVRYSVNAANGRRITVRDLTVDCSTETANKSSVGLSVSGCNVHVEGCSLYSCTLVSTGVHVATLYNSFRGDWRGTEAIYMNASYVVGESNRGGFSCVGNKISYKDSDTNFPTAIFGGGSGKSTGLIMGNTVMHPTVWTNSGSYAEGIHVFGSSWDEGQCVIANNMFWYDPAAPQIVGDPFTAITTEQGGDTINIITGNIIENVLGTDTVYQVPILAAADCIIHGNIFRNCTNPPFAWSGTQIKIDADNLTIA